jgi:hypothetical protein
VLVSKATEEFLSQVSQCLILGAQILLLLDFAPAVDSRLAPSLYG